jgi:hypothetical protein
MPFCSSRNFSREFAQFRGGWQCYERPGVEPYWTGENAKQSATDYAKARAQFGRAEIRVLNHDGKVETIIPLKQGSGSDEA